MNIQLQIHYYSFTFLTKENQMTKFKAISNKAVTKRTKSGSFSVKFPGFAWRKISLKQIRDIAEDKTFDFSCDVFDDEETANGQMLINNSIILRETLSKKFVVR